MGELNKLNFHGNGGGMDNSEWNHSAGEASAIGGGSTLDDALSLDDIVPTITVTTPSIPIARIPSVFCDDKSCKVKTLSTFQARKIRTLPTGEDVLALLVPIEMAAHDDDDEKSRTITFIASTETVDRMGDVIMQDGWKLRSFRKNPVFLWGHNADALPIGRVKRTRVKDGKLMATVVFATAEENPFAELVFKLFKGGFLHAVSVGFQPLEFEPLDEDDTSFFSPLRFTKVDLLEISAVNVPANPEALIVATEKGVITSDERKKFETMSRGHKIDTRFPGKAEKVKLAPPTIPVSPPTIKDFREEASRLRTVRDAIDMTITYLDARAGEQPDEPIDPGIEVVEDADATDVTSTKSPPSLLEEIGKILASKDCGSGPLQEPESDGPPTEQTDDEPLSKTTLRILKEIREHIGAD